MATPTNRLSARWLLAATLLLLDACGGTSSTPALSPQDVAKEKLQQIVSIDVDNEPFDKALARIGRENGVEIRVDMAAVQARNRNKRSDWTFRDYWPPLALLLPSV